MSICLKIKGWATIRKNILDRDNYACRICSKDYGLHVHHIDYGRTNNKESNLVTLCKWCHQAVHVEGYKPCDHEGYPTPWGKTASGDEFNQDYYPD